MILDTQFLLIIRKKLQFLWGTMIFMQVGEARVLEREVVESELTFAGFAVCVQCLFLWLFSLQFHRLM
jgi:hypothetical protein